MANRRRGSSNSDSNSEEVSKLHSLAQLAGVSISTRTHSAVVELLRSGVPPMTVYSLLKIFAARSSVPNKPSSSASSETNSIHKQ